jgi:cytochrome c-type biogenesis protein CcmH
MMAKFNSGILFCLLLALAPPLAAVDRNVAEFSDPVMEQRYRGLLEELRCVVCQNQSLADSNAELAQDLRNEVREMLEQGKSDSEIMAFLVQRYGDFVLYRPPFKSSTWLLWAGPALLLGLALPAMFYFIRRQRRVPESGLNQTEREKLKNLLAEKDL